MSPFLAHSRTYVRAASMLEAQLSIAEGCSSVHGGFVRATERKNEIRAEESKLKPGLKAFESLWRARTALRAAFFPQKKVHTGGPRVPIPPAPVQLHAVWRHVPHPGTAERRREYGELTRDGVGAGAGAP